MHMELHNNIRRNHPTSSSNNKYRIVELVEFSKTFSALNPRHSQRADSNQIKILTVSTAPKVVPGR